MKQTIIEAIRRERLIVILRGMEAHRLIPLAKALYEGGVRMLEVTYSPDGKTTGEETAASIGRLCAQFGDRMMIGAGTVLTAKQVRLTHEAGGGFIISPNVNREVIGETLRLGMVSLPGALTPSEIQFAHECGADFVKLFPVSSLGPDYVRAVRAPLSHIELLAVGGVDLDNIPLYKKAGVVGFGIGSSVTDRRLIEAEDWEGITSLARAYVTAVKGE